MRTFAVLLAGMMLWLAASSAAQAQVSYVTFYQPTTVFSPAVVQPAVVQPTLVSPVVQPVQQTVFFTPAPTMTMQPVARVQTRWRPILGGTVSRVRYGYSPVWVQPAPMVVAF